KIFAAAFAMRVVSGLVLTYQFGTNWSRYSAVLGNVVGPMIGYEVEVAFFLEATFLGVLLFGWERMPPWLHTLAAIAVAGGTLLSAFWILSANSWMQTPTGYEMRDGVAYPLDWLDIVFNPSFPYRLAHMVTAAYLTTSFVVRAMIGSGLLMMLTGLTGAWLWWRGRLFTARWYLFPAQHAWWIGFVAVICGWIVTETGRQPWVAYGVFRTADAVSPVAAGS